MSPSAPRPASRRFHDLPLGPSSRCITLRETRLGGPNISSRPLAAKRTQWLGTALDGTVVLILGLNAHFRKRAPALNCTLGDSSRAEGLVVDGGRTGACYRPMERQLRQRSGERAARNLVEDPAWRARVHHGGERRGKIHSARPHPR